MSTTTKITTEVKINYGGVVTVEAKKDELLRLELRHYCYPFYTDSHDELCAVSLTREEATQIRDAINAWLGGGA